MHIEGITLLGFEVSATPEAEIEVACSPGTYIRSLAHDLGRALGVGAHLVALRRTSSGGFGIEEARSPERLQELGDEGRLERALLAPDRAVERLRAAIVAERHAADVTSGRPFELDVARGDDPPGELEICRAYDLEGRFLAVLETMADGRLHPVKVLRAGLNQAESGADSVKLARFRPKRPQIGLTSLAPKL